jgi:hypothetical protein
VTTNITYTAQFVETTNSYTITWQNHDGTTLETDTNVPYGTTPAYNGVTPVRTGSAQYSYSFTGWSPSIASVTTNITYTAQFAQSTNTYTVIWQNHDGTILETDNNVSYGTTPTFNGANPTKTSTDDYDYAFSGWLPAIASVTENVTYIAQFTENLNYIPITNAQELNNIRNNLSVNYRLMNDIDLESVEWTPIGTDTAPFTGFLDGQGYTISNLKITESQVYVGLFGYNKGTIKNIKLSNVYINVTGGISTNIYGGTFIGYNDSTFLIENLQSFLGEITINKRGVNLGYVGGLIGYTQSSCFLNNSVNNLIVSGSLLNNAGGLIGHGESPITINNSYNNASISGIDYVGGLVGHGQSSLSINNSHNNAFISGVNYVGGLIGSGGTFHPPTIYLTDSTNHGSIRGESYVGGLLGNGNQNSVYVTNCNNLGLVAADLAYVGGLIGNGHRSMIINDSSNENSISGKNRVGGLVGYAWTYTKGTFVINNSFNSGQISATSSSVGGLVANVHSSATMTINKSYNSGIVTGGTSTIGGLVGYGNGNINCSYNSGTVTGDTYIGGLHGYGNVTITNSYNNGTVNGNVYVGGLSAYGWVMNIEQSFNVGSVLGNSYLGGLVGFSNSSLFVFYSVNFGDVIATSNTTAVGGITGFLPTTNDIEQTYYSGTITSNGLAVNGVAFGTKVTDLNTFNLAFFTTTLEWDTEIWDFTGLDIANGVYPTLKNMPVVEE